MMIKVRAGEKVDRSNDRGAHVGPAGQAPFQVGGIVISKPELSEKMSEETPAKKGRGHSRLSIELSRLRPMHMSPLPKPGADFNVLLIGKHHRCFFASRHVPERSVLQLQGLATFMSVAVL
jgi:hypothetical protein